MKIIFLDIDGVLNTSQTFYDICDEYEKTGIERVEIDEFRVALLKDICDQTGAQIVLTSSWRNRWYTTNFLPIKNLSQRIVEADNIFKKFNIKIYGITGKDKNGIRQNEIYEWLNNHPEVESFVIFDDETTFLTDFVGNELIKTSTLPDFEILMNMDNCTGILPEHVQIAINKLNENSKLKILNVPKSNDNLIKKN